MSATLPNLKVISEWLDAVLYQTDFRPVSLLECVKYENNLYDRNQAIVAKINIDTRIENDPDQLVHLVLETIVKKLGVLIFCPTKAR
jgi:DNA polymerase theta